MAMEDFISEEVDVRDEGWVIGMIAQNGHDHLTGLIIRKQEALRMHAILHITGEAQSDAHLRCLELLVEIQGDIDRAFSAVLN